MQPVVQQELTGCGIACAAAIAGLSYQQAKQIANGLGIFADDLSLWSTTDHVRQLLSELGYTTSNGETPFDNWQSLPSCALLAIKWHLEDSTPFWHWVVFNRDQDGEYVLDSNASLPTPIRKDFDLMNPKWFIEVTKLNKPA
jgi:ABC-type bacteriocin/lantibiotic exporter with double-glycine peptidase domain